MVEEVLQLLIGQVYAKLFETIHCEVFKPKNIQDTWNREDEHTMETADTHIPQHTTKSSITQLLWHRETPVKSPVVPLQ